MIAEAPLDRPIEKVTDGPPVYFAGPVDYVEHRSPGAHLTDNWRHRFFGDLEIEMLCPICMNMFSSGFSEVMQVNSQAIARARFLVAYFPGDSVTFGTPIEVWEWFKATAPRKFGDAVLVHPAQAGVFVQYLAEHGLVVVRDFQEARAWLRRRLTVR